MALPWVSDRTAQGILLVVQYAYPVILLFFFLFVFTFRSIILSNSSKDSEPLSSQPTQYGPGGKPLPRKTRRPEDQETDIPLDFSRSRKLLFNWLSVAACASFVANAVNVIAHALAKRKEGWWCGKEVVVRFVALGHFAWIFY